MTANQINYWRLQEEKRSNRSKEAETGRSNRANESISLMQQNEVKRHNIAMEDVDLSKLQETNRHNEAQENIQHLANQNTAIKDKLTLLETNRHNIASENLTSSDNMLRDERERYKNRILADELRIKDKTANAQIDKWEDEALKASGEGVNSIWRTIKDVGGTVLDFIL